ncbi:NAD(P)/FAD-dependent oxidoreductase [Anditalea andensis]|nr:FAD-dependent oxidoreductase [Anditalea andensis]
MDTVIVGGGIVGLFTAYYLQKKGIKVTIIDKGNFTESCSTGNAGMIVPSHIVPLASPGMISKGIGWMFSSKSPFYIHPRLDKELIKWCYYFYKASNVSQVSKAVPVLKDFSLQSKALYLDFQTEHAQLDFSLQPKGLLMLYQSKAAEVEETAFASLAQKSGLNAEILSKEEAQKLEPNQELNIRGALYFPDDAHLDPAKLYGLLKTVLIDSGVRLIPETVVTGFEKWGRKVNKIISDKGSFTCNNLIICTGAWSGALAKNLGFTLPMIGGKGYSFLQPNLSNLKQATILTEAKVTQSPYADFVRFGGTMEISKPNTEINLNRVQGIFSSIQKYYPGLSVVFPEKKAIWSGIRPCSPDGMPYIGPAPGYDNVWVGAGHSMMGVSLAPATGKMLTDLLVGKKVDPVLHHMLFDVDRYNK